MVVTYVVVNVIKQLLVRQMRNVDTGTKMKTYDIFSRIVSLENLLVECREQLATKLWLRLIDCDVTFLCFVVALKSVFIVRCICGF